MKASHLNLISVTSVLSFLSAPLSLSSWGLCVGGVGTAGHTHLQRHLRELKSVQNKPLRLCVCVLF